MIEITEESELGGRPVGTRFTCKGKVYEVILQEDAGCEKCPMDYHRSENDLPCSKMHCTPRFRNDGLETILKLAR